MVSAVSKAIDWEGKQIAKTTNTLLGKTGGQAPQPGAPIVFPTPPPTAPPAMSPSSKPTKKTTQQSFFSGAAAAQQAGAAAGGGGSQGKTLIGG